MKISYQRLWIMLIEKDITKAQLKRNLGLSHGTMSKLTKGEEASMSVLIRICEHLDCDIGDICQLIPAKESTQNITS